MNDNKWPILILIIIWVVLTILIALYFFPKASDKLEKYGSLIIALSALVISAYYSYQSNVLSKKTYDLSKEAQLENFELQKKLYEATVKSYQENKENMDSTYLLNKNLADLQEKNYKSSIEFQEKTFSQTATLTRVNAKLQAYVFLQDRVNATVNELISLQRGMYTMDEEQRSIETMRISAEVMEISRRLSDSIISYARFFEGIDSSDEYLYLFHCLEELKSNFNKAYEVAVYRAAESFLQRLSDTIFEDLDGKKKEAEALSDMGS